MEENNALLSLQNLLQSAKLDMDDADKISRMIRKEKERQVLKKHKYKIGGPYKSRNRTIWQTRAPWLPSKNLNRQSYDELIDALYQYYYEDSIKNDPKQATVQQIFEQMMADYEQMNVFTNLTVVHYKADWKKHIVDKNCKWLNVPIKDVLPGQVYEHYRFITANCAIKRSTFNNVKSVVNAVFDYAINRNISCISTRTISTRNLRFAPVEDKWEGVYTDLDRQKILKACEEMPPTVYTKAIELMFCLDIRIGELRALYKENVDLEHKTVYIGHQMVDIKTEKVNRHSVRTNIMKD